MTPKQILVPIDFSEHSTRALDYACALAVKLEATVHVVTALGALLPELSVALTDAMIADLTAARRRALHDLVTARRATCPFGLIAVRSGDARDAILEAARQCHADLIVMGTHGRHGLARLVIGSVAESIVRRAACPVLTVRAGEVAP